MNLPRSLALRLLCVDIAPEGQRALQRALEQLCPGSLLEPFDPTCPPPLGDGVDGLVLGASMTATRRAEVLQHVAERPDWAATPVLELAESAAHYAETPQDVDAVIALPIQPEGLRPTVRWLVRLRLAKTPLNPDQAARKDAQAPLQAGVDSERMFFERSIDAIATCELITDAGGQPVDYRLLSINPAAEAYLGRSADELCGHPVRTLAPQTEPPWLRTFAAVAKGGPQADLMGVEPIRQRYVRVRAFPMTPGRFGLIFADVSSDRAAAYRRALQTRRSQALLEFPRQAEQRSEAEFMHHALSVAEDLTNSAVSFVYFVADDASAIEPVTWSQRTPQQYREVVPEPHYPVAQAGIFNDYANYPHRRDLHQGQTHLERLLTVPTMEAGKVVMLTAVANAAEDYGEDDLETVQLISDTVWSLLRRRRAEQALLESETQLKLALAAANQGVYDLNVQTGLAVVSREYATMLGYEADDFQETNRTWLNRVHPQDRAAVKAMYLGYIRQQVPEYRIEFRMKAKDGQWRWILSVGKIIAFDANGAPVRMVGTHTDLTEQKRAEEEREALQASLAQSDRLASMGMLAAGVAHEINNPLTYVLYCVESLSEDLPQLQNALQGQTGVVHAVAQPAALQEMVEQAQEAYSGILRIKEIVRGLGTFSRVEQVELGPVNVHDSINHALSMASNEIKYRARVVKSLGPVPEVFASEGKLAQVFLNLLINAAHAIDEGRVEDNEIRVRTWAEDGWVVAEVEDSGGGIAEHDRERIFDPFYTTKGVGVGSGLGLSLCHSIIVGFAGTISLASPAGESTCFQVRIPARGSQRPIAAQTPQKISAPRRSTRSGRVLIVDDEEGIRRLLTKILEVDYQTEAVASGEKALALLSQDRGFDVVLCDLMMPKMSGMELHAHVQGFDSALAGCFVFVTGGAFTPGAAEYLSQSAVPQIKKPFDSAEVMAVVDEILTH